MKFLNYSNEASHSELKKKHDEYLKYLYDNRQAFSQETFEFASADWHYDPQDPRCPHDSWLESIQILEGGIYGIGGQRNTRIQLKLLGAYHDGNIEIDYEGVRGYRLALPSDLDYEIRHLGDWIVDEIRVTHNNWLVHEIRFWLEGDWQIECDNIIYQWRPFQK